MTIGGLFTSLDTWPLVYAKNLARVGWFTVSVKNIYIRVRDGQSAIEALERPPFLRPLLPLGPFAPSSFMGSLELLL